jgi:hypothetical protein
VGGCSEVVLQVMLFVCWSACEYFTDSAGLWVSMHTMSLAGVRRSCHGLSRQSARYACCTACADTCCRCCLWCASAYAGCLA